MDLALGFFENVIILRSPRFNVAPCNLSQRNISGTFDFLFRVEGRTSDVFGKPYRTCPQGLPAYCAGGGPPKSMSERISIVRTSPDDRVSVRPIMDESDERARFP